MNLTPEEVEALARCQLTSEELAILRWRAQEPPRSVQEIAEFFGATRQWVYAVLNRAMGKIQEQKNVGTGRND